MANAGIEIRERKANPAGIIDKFLEWSLNYIPDSMVFVQVLSVIVFLMALGLTDHGPMQLIDDYAKGFWLLLTFAMQMCVLMITGYVVADSKLVNRAIVKLIDWPKTAKSTVVMYVMVVGAVSWAHWGAGMMLAIVMGQKIAARKRGLGIHLPFLAAIGYATMCIMCNGPSQAVPLLMATPGHFLDKLSGIVPMSQTVFSLYWMTLMVILFVTLPILAVMIMPKKENAVEIDDATYNELTQFEAEVADPRSLRPAERWDRSRILQTIVSIAILIWMGRFIVTKGIGSIDLNVLNFGFFGLCLLLHGSPRNFIASVKRGVGTTFGVIIQFPMYAGIFGIISFSGLAAVITHWFVSISTQGTYPWIVFLYTGLMDFFVPSAGSKFAIEAPYILPAGKQLGVAVQQTLIGYSAGGQWANLIQPFWALPAMAAFKVRFQDILPYNFALWVYVGIITTIYFLAFPAGF